MSANIYVLMVKTFTKISRLVLVIDSEATNKPNRLHPNLHKYDLILSFGKLMDD